MQEVFEKIKQRIIIAATEAYGYAPMTRVVSEAELKEILEKVEEEYGDGWIPCSKRLPEEYNSILLKLYSRVKSMRASVFSPMRMRSCGMLTKQSAR